MVGQGFDKRVVTQVAKEENHCFACSVAEVELTQDGQTRTLKAGLFKFGDRMKNGVFDVTKTADPVEVFEFHGQEGSVVGSKGTKLDPSGA